MLADSSIVVAGQLARNASVLRFAIVSGMEVDAAEYLVMQLSDVVELTLRNDKDEQGEGATTVRVRGTAFELREGGHGWQGQWQSISEEALKSLIVDLAIHNRGGHHDREAQWAVRR